MLQVARLAPNLLQEASDRVVEFLQGQLNPDGGGRDRGGDSDLYYTVFTLEGLIALRAELPVERVQPYLESHGHGADLDLVHLTCLARCWAAMPGDGLPSETRRLLLERVEDCRSADGGYAAEPGDEHGTVYHAFLALGAYQDMGVAVPNPQGMIASLEGLRTAEGGYANDRVVPLGTSPTTAAAVTLLRQLGAHPPPAAGQWLRERFHPQGGFSAAALAPIPDLLSTATVLHALAGMHTPFDDLKERCLDFVDSLWTGQAFCGNWTDDEQDSEYTYYGLLALGHLSL